MKVYVANVGVNSADANSRGLKSPIFKDRTFEFIPIKEPKVAVAYSTITYESLKCSNNPQRPLSYYLPNKLHKYVVHNDPEFTTFTYGDVYSSRAANLRFVKSGDILIFLARLYDHDENYFTGKSNFYFIGFLNVERHFEFTKDDWLDSSMKSDWSGLENNTHFYRFRNGYKGDFRIIVGNSSTSARFRRALKITPDIVELLYNAKYDSEKDIFISNTDQKVIKNKSNDKPRRYSLFHSTTRSIQSYLDSTNSAEKKSIEKLMALFRQQYT